MVNEYIESGFVEVLNWRGKEKIIMNIMNDCYKKNNKKYDWLIFYEFDEFIFLKNFTSIKSYLNEKQITRLKQINIKIDINKSNQNKSRTKNHIAKKIEDKGKEELEKIIEIRNSINDEIKNNILETKKFREDINKKIKENNNEMNISKRKIENLLEQIKEMNKNISNINMKMKNTSNTSNIMNNRNMVN